MKKYKFTDDTWWFSNGCSCCDDLEMPCFNSDDTDCNLGSAGSVEDCYVQSIITEIGRATISDEYEDELYQMELTELKQVAIVLGIEVEIIS